MGEWCNAKWRWIFSPRPVKPYNLKWEEDRNWYQSIAPKEGVDYKDLQEFSEKKYAESCAVHDAIDKKAEWLFGISVAAIGALFVAIKSWGLSWWLCVPSLFCAVVAMTLCLRTRDPGNRTTQMTIRNMISVRENCQHWMLAMVASIHCAVAGLNCVIDWKGEQLARASRWLITGALLFFILPLALNRAAFVFRKSDVPREVGYSESHQRDREGRTAIRPAAVQDLNVRAIVRRESRFAAQRAIQRFAAER